MLREEIESHLDGLKGEVQPIAASPRLLRVTSHWSGVCTQSRSAVVLQNNQVVKCKFEHVQDSGVVANAGGFHIRLKSTL